MYGLDGEHDTVGLGICGIGSFNMMDTLPKYRLYPYDQETHIQKFHMGVIQNHGTCLEVRVIGTLIL